MCVDTFYTYSTYCNMLSCLCMSVIYAKRVVRTLNHTQTRPLKTLLMFAFIGRLCLSAQNGSLTWTAVTTIYSMMRLLKSSTFQPFSTILRTLHPVV